MRTRTFCWLLFCMGFLAVSALRSGAQLNDYQIRISNFESGKDGTRGVMELKPAGARPSGPVTKIAFESKSSLFDGSSSSLTATRLSQGCSSGSIVSGGCDRADFALLANQVRVKFFDFARGKGILLVFDSFPSLAPSASFPMRVASLSLNRANEPLITVQIDRKSGVVYSLVFEATVSGHRYRIRSEYLEENKGPSLRYAVLLPLAELLHSVIEGEISTASSGSRVPRATEKGTQTEPPSSGSGTSCSICDLCSHVPGGETVSGCLGGPGGVGGGVGGGGPRHPGTGHPPCTIHADTAAEILAEVLFTDFAFSFCKTDSSTSDPEFAFSYDADYFSSAPAPDPGAVKCSSSFVIANMNFYVSFATTLTPTSPGIIAVAHVLAPKCIRTLPDLKDAANSSEYCEIRLMAIEYMRTLQVAKKSCDDTLSIAHRSYCGCPVRKYLHYLPGPYPGDSSCVP
jgi:hypothetical protein